MTANVGRDLTLSSQQDSDRYDARQSSVSGGISVPVGPGVGGAQLSASRDKLHSNYDSVQEQTGIYAGQGGFDITVGHHTQLDGAVIASQAEKSKNSLDTGTLGFNDIHNQADFKTEHQGGSFSTGGSLLGNVLSNSNNLSLAGANNSGHAEGTSQAAVSEGNITIRDQASQQQDIAELSRDTEHANGSIGAIFDKEKEQNRLKEVQLIGEIGGQAMDIIRTQGDINGLEEALKRHPELKGDIEALRNTDTYQAEMQKYGTGSDLQKAAQAVTAALQGLAGGNISQALAGGMNPYVAEQIKKYTGGNDSANVLAHAVWGAIAAEMSGNSAAAGAAGAAGGELAARYLAEKLYGADTADKIAKLSEEQKQNISSLSTLAAGLAGGVSGDSSANALAGAQAGKNAVENNALSDIIENKVSGVSQEEKYQNAQKELVAAVEEFKAQNCAGMSAEACSAKISEHRDELLKGATGFGVDFVPVLGDIKSFAEAQSSLDYLVAVIGIIPGAGDAVGKAIKAAEAALKKGDVAEASKLINKASDEIAGYLPSPGNTSLPSSGIGSNAAFSVTNAQLGKKLGKHVEDFGGNPSNAADRQRVLEIINDIGSNPDKVIAGKFAGQGAGAGASRGDVFFRIKGNDVVVTKPDGSFVTVLKDGVTNNTSVINALKGNPQ
ncbi:VENN motif-containing pre-toxin protein [Serratia fonticola]|uniref:VENN motif-containing pre-toxin protein n=1 Tax=Serratia fonticola TaxID=47917 RepID=A0A542CXH0_SERFO|nr:VENN motif-containing pre-toxin protein [Serratia fonticola]TQI95517.1 VENN motif-containing pre-toxin protein [Serratia fonticola]TVZ70012.1 VENN motif-containing pre-toxin protein [Serratia fonticola]